MSDFQQELHNNGYNKVVIIGIGQTAQANFNSSFCTNSDIPLINDQSPDLPIHSAFNAEHRALIIMDVDGETELYREVLNSTLFQLYENNFRDVIISNYPSSIIGDVNNDDIVNILDVVHLVNMVLSNEYSDDADMNFDGTINILDIVQIANIILSD